MKQEEKECEQKVRGDMVQNIVTVKSAEILGHKLQVFRKFIEYMISFLVHFTENSADVIMRREQLGIYAVNIYSHIARVPTRNNYDAIYSYSAKLGQRHCYVQNKKQ